MRSLLLCMVMFVTPGCDYVGSYLFTPTAPKFVWIDDGKDGRSMVACKGEIHVISRESGYQIEFTDADGLNHAFYGIKRFSLADVPPLVKSNLPYPEPNLYNFNNNENSLPTYSNGQSVHNGDAIVWSAGQQAKFVVERDAGGKGTSRHWEPVLIHNTVCDASK